MSNSLDTPASQQIRGPTGREGTALEQDATDKLLAAIEGVDKKIDRHNRTNDERFLRIEDALGEHRDKLTDHRAELTEHRAELTEHRDQLATHNTLLREQAQSLTTIAGTAARAGEHALVKQDETLEAVLSSVSKTIAHKWLRIFLVVCAGVGAMGGCAGPHS